jgi:Methyltransferase domain
MCILAADDQYNRELFEGNACRRFLHERRFFWLAAQAKREGIERARVLEIGCHDAKTIHYLEESGVVVERYVGYDSNEGSVAMARQKWLDRSEVTISTLSDPSEAKIKDGSFNIGVCMETLEHVPPELVDGYLSLFARAVAGPVFVTIPVERGWMLLAKQLSHRLFGIRSGDRLTGRELLNGIIGRTHHISRHEHRGFDDREMLRQIRRHFQSVSSQRLFVPYVTTLNFCVGITAENAPD